MTAEITVEPLNCGHIGNRPFVCCRDVIPILEVFPNIGCILKYTALMLFRPFHMLNVATTSWPELFEHHFHGEKAVCWKNW